MRSIWTTECDRFIHAVTVVPDSTAWLVCLGLLILYGAIALPIGFRASLLQVEFVKSWKTIVFTGLFAFLFPSIVEETIFRVLLLPYSAEHRSTQVIILSCVISLGLFILAHPLNALFVMKSRRSTFFDPTFLCLAGMLGVVCTLTYLQSESLWPPVILHWMIVLVWLLCLGGNQRMTPQQSD